MNEKGHPETLQPFAHDNTAALRHGLYNGREISERAGEIREALQEAPWATALDAIAAEEMGSVVAALETIDAELGARPRAAGRRMLLEHKARLSRVLQGLGFIRRVRRLSGSLGEPVREFRLQTCSLLAKQPRRLRLHDGGRRREVGPEPPEAPSEPQKAAEAVVIDIYAEADRRWDDLPPKAGLRPSRRRR